MKKITFLNIFLMMFFISGYAQFGCGEAVVITNGFTQNAITTPGDGGEENWADLPAGTSIDQYYWNDDVYLFQYTAGATDESVSMTTFSRSSWNGIGIFSSCTGNSFSGELAAVGSSGGNVTKTVTATVAAGQTVYIATGQWGSPNNLDFDVVSFSANPIVLPPNCNVALISPANNATAAPVNGILAWTAATGSPTGYKLRVGTTSGGIEVGEFVLGNITTYNIPGLLAGDTTYYVTIIPTNGNGDAAACTEYSFTTGPTPIEGVLCENAIIIGALPYNTVDNTSNYEDIYYEETPGASGCGSTSSYLNGNDVVYSYTSTFSGTMKLQLTGAGTYTGVFIYGSCSDIGVNCLGGAVNGFAGGPMMLEEFPVETGETYYIVISTWATPQTTAYTLDIIENTCTNGAATYTVVSDCANGEQFVVDVNITDLGSATSMTVNDNQGSAPQTVSATGIVTFGPYPNTTPVIFTVNNDQDETCFLTSPSRTQAVCPPVNDTCEGAIDLTNETSPLMSTTVGATNTNLTVCNNSNEEVANIYSDVYYSILVPSGSLLTIGVTATNYDTANVVFYGDCDNRTSIACFDDPNLRQVQWTNTTGQDQTVYWIQDGWSGAGTFTLAWSVIACTPSEATYTVVSDCENGEQFNVDVNVTNLGSATSVTISDNQGSAPQVASATGNITFGPYPNTTSVIFTVVNDQDDNCTLTSPARTQDACPPNCDEAEVITACDEEVTAILAGPGAWSTSACGYSTPGVEQVYSFTPTETGVYQLEVVSTSSNFANFQYHYIDYAWKEANGVCSATGWTCIDDLYTTGITTIGTLTAGVEYLFLLDSEAVTERTHTFKIKCLPTCTNGTSTYTIVSDCENGEQFFVNVNVTSLGTATSVTVSDDQGSEPQVVTETGMLTFGPYPNGEPVIFTNANDGDETCVWSSGAINQVNCPPANDECINAIGLTVGAVFADNEIVGTNLGATRNPNDHDPTTETIGCDTYNFNTNGKDVWYKAIVPLSGTLTIETAFNDDEDFDDTSLYIYTGSCEDFVYVQCSGDISSLLENYFSKTVLTGLVPGEEVTARVFGYNGSAGSFKISAYDASLTNAQFDSNTFKVYPNPVKDVLNLSYTQNISSVEVFNMLGQQVLAKSVNDTQGQVDMSNLATGAYIVKIASENQIKTVKVLKQ